MGKRARPTAVPHDVRRLFCAPDDGVVNDQLKLVAKCEPPQVVFLEMDADIELHPPFWTRRAWLLRATRLRECLK